MGRTMFLPPFEFIHAQAGGDMQRIEELMLHYTSGPTGNPISWWMTRKFRKQIKASLAAREAAAPPQETR